tara:strand:+ start:305 stop:574 length:270 start_codon:yes stop_codon:yes gene_type:complete
MKLPNKIEPIEPNYDEIDAIILLERWYDEWSKDEDWWSGGNTWDLNIFAYDDENPNDYTINVYGLVRYDDDEHPSTDTSNELDRFELKL